MIPVPLWAIFAALLGAVVFAGGTSFAGYEHGVAVQEARQTKIELKQANDNLAASQKNQDRAAQAGEEHDSHTTQVNVDTSAIARALRDSLSKIPAASDPVVAVWVVRMFDRSASRAVDADPYPGKSDGDPSDFRLSQVIAMLAADFGKCELNRTQLTDIIKLKPVLPAPAPPPKSDFFDRLNPFKEN